MFKTSSVLSLRLLVAGVVAVGCVFFGGARSASGVVNGQLIPCNDRRFDVVGLLMFVGGEPCGGYVSGSCVLIAPDRVLIARHEFQVGSFSPLPNLATQPYKVRFRRAINGFSFDSYFNLGDQCHGVYQEISLVQVIDAPTPGSDLVIGVLSQPVVGIRPVGVALTTAMRAGTSITLAGWGASGTCLSAGERFTLKRSKGLLPWDANAQFLSFTPCTIGTTDPCFRCPSGSWVGANTWDSGAPIFIEDRTDTTNPFPELRLVGIVSTTQTAMRPAAWNAALGLPAFTDTPLQTPQAKGDFNRDGTRSIEDLLQYISAFFQNQCSADLDGSVGTSTPSIEDLFQFLRWWMTP